MNNNISQKIAVAIGSVLITWGSASTAEAVSITTFSDRNNFNAAVNTASLIVEDFTDTAHFPISTGILNSQTDLVVLEGSPIKPGDIKPGVTYSTPIGNGNFFNIDTGGGFSQGGFLDSVKDDNPNRVLTIDFDNNVSAFGFDTNSFMGSSFNLTIKFALGSDFVQNFPINTSNPSEILFFGFKSNETNIKSIIIDGNGQSNFAFALDNFTFTNNPNVSVPEPSLMVGLLVFSAFSAGYKKLYRKQYW
jgi:hypothetical protein